ncbi:hypothetical protein HCBG_05593 [Histoplasma capsulatum G186AR]|uniref:Uncharacterized protein n=1 Tax=Ajellomyces capsulatus (strain G186AR / H82 / ATCC MYA-2454 / RMSCC 2432) TaxID=447093 RepID=C0NRG3_AJECG|nr:uncharacterized protein HCBG_05593 [Histoplasma capsulatum G186AR]EEH06277.1 hypothetical protein HCBG_05593 [Histoplasma capsulatum G186AR]
MAEPRVKAEVLPKFDVRDGLRDKPQLGLGESRFQAGNKREKRRQVGGRCKLRRKKKKGERGQHTNTREGGWKKKKKRGWWLKQATPAKACAYPADLFALARHALFQRVVKGSKNQPDLPTVVARQIESARGWCELGIGDSGYEGKLRRGEARRRGGGQEEERIGRGNCCGRRQSDQ